MNMLTELITGFIQGVFFACMIVSFAMIAAFVVAERKKGGKGD